MKKSAGILLFRRQPVIQVLLVHPGGPFFAKKDAGSWSIPKGEYEASETPLSAAKREFKEETGQALHGHFIPLQPVTQKGGKIVTAWAVEGNLDENTVYSNTFELIWPPNSNKLKVFPEIDKAAWFTLSEAAKKINPGQLPLLAELKTILQSS